MAANVQELATGYAALILADQNLEVTAEKLTAVAKAAGITLEPIWATTFERVLKVRVVVWCVCFCGCSLLLRDASSTTCWPPPRAEEEAEEADPPLPLQLPLPEVPPPPRPRQPSPSRRRLPRRRRWSWICLDKHEEFTRHYCCCFCFFNTSIASSTAAPCSTSMP